MNISFQPPEEDDPRDDDQRMQEASLDIESVARSVYEASSNLWMTNAPYDELHDDDKAECRSIARAALAVGKSTRGHMGATPDGGIDDHAEPYAPPKLRTYAEMLEAGIDAADTLKAIGARIGYGRAQQILGEEWELRHGCAPRGRMGMTARDDAVTVTVLRDALLVAHSHIDMAALRVSHCQDAAIITAAIAKAAT